MTPPSIQKKNLPKKPPPHQPSSLPALVPYRRHGLLCTQASTTDPFVLLNSPSQTTTSSGLQLARKQLVTALWHACGCSSNLSHACRDCRAVLKWAVQFLSNTQALITVVEYDTDTVKLQVHVQAYRERFGWNLLQSLLVNGRCIRDLLDDDDKTVQQPKDDVMIALELGDVLTLQSPLPNNDDNEPLEFQVARLCMENTDNNDESSQRWIVIVDRETEQDVTTRDGAVSRATPTAARSCPKPALSISTGQHEHPCANDYKNEPAVPVTHDVKVKDTNNSPVQTTPLRPTAPASAAQHETPLWSPELQTQCFATQEYAQMDDNELQSPQESSPSHATAASPLDPVKANPYQGAAKPINNPGQLEDNALVLGDTGSVATKKVPAADVAAEEEKDDKTKTTRSRLVLYLVPLGFQLMDSKARASLKRNCQLRGATVLDSFDKNQPPWPTHLIISPELEPPLVVEELGFENENDLEEFLGDHGIECAVYKWAAYRHCYCPRFTRLGMEETYLGLVPKQPTTRGEKRQSPDKSRGSPRSVRARAETSAKASFVLNTRFETNLALSNVFHELSKLHKECPLEKTDEWRSYSFSVTSGRLRQLGFEITDDDEVLDKVRAIKGIGNAQMEIIKEFLRNDGMVTRIQEFESNPKRVAMKRMMNIWGVGRVKAMELVQLGFETIPQVRQAVQEGTLTLDRNQYIGLLCYEDILERMSREEVEAIGAIVANAFRERYPSAEINVMGSYRRGKESCGDVDILIVHPHFHDTIHPHALGKVIDELRDQGHIAYHLTFVSGMDHKRYETLPPDVVPRLTSPRQYGRRHDRKEKTSSSSYMGVFNSPTVSGKRRRVDIKFYPYRERAYASLYFTGNGWFNRSMRLWATRKHKYTLNDHGLFVKGSKDVRVMEAKSEREVFDRLGLAWKEPHERDCYDAVMSKQDGEYAAQLECLSRKELLVESEENVWID